MLLPKDQLTICFAHSAYRMAERFAARATGIRHLQVFNADQLTQALPDADVLVVSMMWRNQQINIARKLKFIQSISAGVDQYDQNLLRARGIRLASAAGVNAQAVAEHAMALILALRRKLHISRDNQMARFWRPMAPDIASREDQLGGKTLLIVGLGRIGARLAKLGKAFGMQVIATKRDSSQGAGDADEVFANDQLPALLGRADVVALTCPLTPATENLIDAKALGLMKPTAHLVNVGRGKIVDEDALIRALNEQRIAAAGLDVTREEPLPAASPLWALPNAFITSHVAGETQRYEDSVIDILLENLDRLWRGETSLRNQIV
jgi:phosphoglycerate dehydrogenase-like enzyme